MNLDIIVFDLSSELNLRSLEASMKQSGRTTQLTILAFAFLPINVVAGASGTNVDMLGNSHYRYLHIHRVLQDPGQSLYCLGKARFVLGVERLLQHAQIHF